MDDEDGFEFVLGFLGGGPGGAVMVFGGTLLGVDE